MSLVGKHTMTEKNLAAHRSNGRKSRGAATAEGKERSRAANLRHGYYSKVRDEALAALGEDPADLTALIAGAYEQWHPANGHQAWIVEHQAHLQWRIQRAERIQESLAAGHVAEVEARRREKALELRYSCAPMEDCLIILFADLARPDFYAPPGYFRRFTKAFEGRIKGRVKVILEVLHRLRKPTQFEPAPGPLPAEATSDEVWEEQLAEMEEDDFPIPDPEIAVIEGEEREGCREDLRTLVRLEQQDLDATWNRIFAEHERPLTTMERDCAAAEAGPQMELMRREESSCFREFWRLGNTLMKLQDRAEGQESGVRGPESEGQDLGFRSQDLGTEKQDLGAAGGMAADVGPNGVRPHATAVPDNKNEDAPGHVQENTGGDKSEEMTDSAAAVAGGREEAPPLSADLPKIEGIPGSVASDAVCDVKFAEKGA